jgi:hypothetical protein
MARDTPEIRTAGRSPMRLEPSLSDFAISHQLNSVRGAESRKSQFLKSPYFMRYEPSGGFLVQRIGQADAQHRK